MFFILQNFKNMSEILAEYAVVRANIFLIIASLIAIILLFVSVNIIFFKKKIYTQSVVASITMANCTQGSNQKQNKISFSCNVDVKYTVAGQEYTANLTKEQDTKLEAGKTLEIYYEKDKPNNVAVKPDTNVDAYIFLIFGALLVGGAYLSLYFTKKYKGFAVVSGGVQAIGDVTTVFRR